MDFKTIRSTAPALVEIDVEHYEYMLNTLPPIRGRGCFAMGEPVAHTNAGVTYYWAAKRGERHFAFYGTRDEAELAFSR